MNQVADCISSSTATFAHHLHRRSVHVSIVDRCNDHEAFGASATKSKLRDKILVVNNMLAIMYAKKRYLHIQGYFHVSMYTYTHLSKKVCVYTHLYYN